MERSALGLGAHCGLPTAPGGDAKLGRQQTAKGQELARALSERRLPGTGLRVRAV